MATSSQQQKAPNSMLSHPGSRYRIPAKSDRPKDRHRRFSCEVESSQRAPSPHPRLPHCPRIHPGRATRENREQRPVNDLWFESGLFVDRIGTVMKSFREVRGRSWHLDCRWNDKTASSVHETPGITPSVPEIALFIGRSHI